MHILKTNKKIRITILSLLALVVLLIVFRAGVSVGYHKARFNEHFSKGFERNFIEGRGGFFKKEFDRRRPIPISHGAVGEIVSIKFPLMVVAGPDNLEKTIVIKTDTRIRKFRDQVGTSTLAVGDKVVVLGEPDDQGQIEAKLIRLISSNTDNITR